MTQRRHSTLMVNTCSCQIVIYYMLISCYYTLRIERSRSVIYFAVLKKDNRDVFSCRPSALRWKSLLIGCDWMCCINFKLNFLDWEELGRMTRWQWQCLKFVTKLCLLFICSGIFYGPGRCFWVSSVRAQNVKQVLGGDCVLICSNIDILCWLSVVPLVCNIVL